MSKLKPEELKEALEALEAKDKTSLSNRFFGTYKPGNQDLTLLDIIKALRERNEKLEELRTAFEYVWQHADSHVKQLWGGLGNPFLRKYYREHEMNPKEA